MAETIVTKTCRVCKETKPISEFYTDRTHKDGYKNICKSCRLQQCKQYRKTKEYKDAQKRYNKSEKGKARKKWYDKSEEGKATRKRYRQSEKSFDLSMLKLRMRLIMQSGLEKLSL